MSSRLSEDESYWKLFWSGFCYDEFEMVRWLKRDKCRP